VSRSTERAFDGRSGLMREKWDERHHANGATYGEETINRAIANTTAVYNPKGGPDIFAQDARYYCSKKDRVYPITNFLIEPLDWIVAEDEGQFTADLINFRGDRHRLTFMTNDLGSLVRFKNVLNRLTIELSFFGNENDLEQLKDYVSSLPWERKIGVKALGIHEYSGRLVFVGSKGTVETGGASVDDIVQLEKYKGITSEILSKKPLDADGLKELGPLLMEYNEPAKTVPVLAWTTSCFVKPHLRKAGIKSPQLSLIGEAGSGKSNTLERVIMPVFSRAKITAAPQATAFTLMRDSASSNMIP